MQQCFTCGKTIRLGGKRDGDLLFCNTACYEKRQLVDLARRIPEEVVEEHAKEVHGGICPKCQGPGPVDIHTSHRIHSLLLFTSWSSRVQISCRSCGSKAKVEDLFYCLFLGWWGFPWGLLMTPVQLFRNVYGIMNLPETTQPSERLKQTLRFKLAAEVLNRQSRSQVPALPELVDR